MSINIFIESTDFFTKGAYFFNPQHALIKVDVADIDAIYFPHMINGGFLTPKMKQLLVKQIPREYLGTELEYEYTNGQVPKYLCSVYKKRIKKAYPSIADKPIVFLHIADFPFPYDVDDNTIVVRCSINRTTMQKNDIVMPARIPYFDWEGPQTEIKPSIGFCGCPTTHNTRRKLINELISCKTIEFDYFLTNRFYNHIDKVLKYQYKDLATKNIGTADVDTLAQEIKLNLKHKFNKKLKDNIFSLCPRGRGNYSVRFYETLRAGRIPVMVDSDQVFPCEDIIDWNDIVICTDNVEEMIQKIYDWTENRDLIEVQKRCREVWETYLNFPNFVELLPKYIANSLS